MTILITAEELRAGLGSCTILDVRYRLTGPNARADYEAGHVAGAAFVDLDVELAATPGRGGRHPLPDPDTFAAAMRGHGVSADRTVVCYDFSDSSWAARAWWLLRYHGHPDVRLLDGGYAAWERAGGPVEAGPATPERGDFQCRPGGMPMLTATEAGELARAGRLLDARAAVRYRGESEPIDPVAGHIPGALSVPTLDNVDDQGMFLSPDRLRDRFAERGVPPAGPVGAYCGSGVTAAHEVVALMLAGHPEAPLYVGSWSEWITDPARPVTTGAEPG